jgi:hypothetical protein
LITELSTLSVEYDISRTSANLFERKYPKLGDILKPLILFDELFVRDIGILVFEELIFPPINILPLFGCAKL